MGWGFLPYRVPVVPPASPHSRRLRRLAASLGVALGCALAVAAAAGAQGAPGYDISYPQCGKATPTDAQFAVIGVNGGRPGIANRCLSTQLAWAAALPGSGPQPALSLYVNTADPGKAASDWPAAGSGPQPCDGTWAAGCAFDYGQAKATQAFSFAQAAAQSATAAGAPAVSLPALHWWLDVETANSWAGPSQSAAWASLNIAALQGFVSGLTGAGVDPALIGFYSTAHQWKAITGLDAIASPSVFATTFANWLAGAASLTTATGWCTTVPGFAGGQVGLVQFPAGGFDGDVACAALPPAPAPMPTPAPAPAPAPASGSVTIAPGTTGSTPSPPIAALGNQAVTVGWQPTAVATPTQVTLLPVTPTTAPQGLTPTGAAAVSLAFPGTPAGSPPPQLGAPLDLHIPAFPALAQAIPYASPDGTTWTQLAPLPTPGALPAGAQDGYTQNADGSLDVLTLHAGQFALFRQAGPPAAPRTLATRFVSGSLLLRWSQPASPGDLPIASYQLLLDGSPLSALPGSATSAAIRTFKPHAKTVFRLVAVDTANRQSKPSTPIVVARTPVPAGLPRTIPDWAWKLLAWRQGNAATRGARPATPSPLPGWWWRWAAWRAAPFRVLR